MRVLRDRGVRRTYKEARDGTRERRVESRIRKILYCILLVRKGISDYRVYIGTRKRGPGQ